MPPGADPLTLAQRARAARVIDASEVEILDRARRLTAEVIRVDDFEQDLGAAAARALRERGAEASNQGALVQRAAA
jgi:hypothetical protein